MKPIKILLLVFIPFSLVAQQETSNDTGFYLDPNIGFLISEDDFVHGFNLSAGHGFTKNHALGLSLNQVGVTTLETNRSLIGLSLEPKLTLKKVHIKLNGGLILNAKFFDGYCDGKKIGKAYFYFRPAFEYRIGLVTLGVSSLFAPQIVFNVIDHNAEMPSGFCESNQRKWSSYDSRFVLITLGLSFPKFIKQ